MSTDKKTSVLIDSLLPDFLETEGPKFQQFIKAYYEWLETSNQITERSKNLLNYRDIDLTVDEFVKYFRREVLASFPEDILANKALVYKRIKDLYNAKGTENAYKLLFRILFDEEIELYYPGDDILIASDGRWVQDNTIRLSSPFVGNPENFGGKDVVGQTSGATAKVNRVVSTTEVGIPVFELFLINIEGTFLDTEIVASVDGTISGVIISSIGPLQGVIVEFGGAGHQKNDIVNLTSTSGSGASGIITKTDDTSLTFRIVNGGSGYVVNNVVTLTGGNGIGASARVSAIANTEILPVYTDTISSLANVPLNTGPTFVSTGANTSSVSVALAAANVSSTLASALGTSNVTVGTISSLSFNRGSEYTTLPTLSVINDEVANQFLDDGAGGFKGRNAVIVANNLAGSIASVRVTAPGTLYNRSDVITITNQTRANTDNALGAAQVTGVINYPGSYRDTRGFLSWNTRLQDNFFYQEYSYVVRSSKVLEAYKDLSYKVAHPAGMKLFGEVRITANIDFTTSVIFEPVVRPFDIITPDIFIPTVVSESANTYVSSGEDGAIVPLPELEMPIDISIADVSNYDLISDNGFELEINLVTPINVPNVELYVNLLIEDVTIASALTFGNTSVVPTITPDIIEGRPWASLLISSFSSNTISDYSNVSLSDMYIAGQFGEPSLSFAVNANSIFSAAVVSNDAEIDMNIGGTTLISITPTTIVSSNASLQFLGDGTISNFLINDISDLQSASINNYSQLFISAGDGNKVFNGFNTSFTTQLSPGSIMIIVDVNGTNNEFTTTVSAINDANTLSVTSNVLHSNGSLAIVNNATYFIIS